MKQLSLRVDDELYEKIEQARGQIPRERWMRALIERELDGQDGQDAELIPDDRAASGEPV